MHHGFLSAFFRGSGQNPPPNLGIKSEISRLWSIPDHQYGAIRRKEERSKATPPFGFSQGREPVERQMMP
jgi:hypothetical protein